MGLWSEINADKIAISVPFWLLYIYMYRPFGPLYTSRLFFGGTSPLSAEKAPAMTSEVKPAPAGCLAVGKWSVCVWDRALLQLSDFYLCCCLLFRFGISLSPFSPYLHTLAFTLYPHTHTKSPSSVVDLYDVLEKVSRNLLWGTGGRATPPEMDKLTDSWAASRRKSAITEQARASMLTPSYFFFNRLTKWLR